jgi:hypothetical protein
VAGKELGLSDCVTVEEKELNRSDCEELLQGRTWSKVAVYNCCREGAGARRLCKTVAGKELELSHLVELLQGRSWSLVI